MNAIEDLEAKVERLEDQLGDARRKLKQARLDAAPVKVGDVVLSRRFGEVRVTVVDVPWGTTNKPWIHGNPRKKDGTFGSARRALYNDWELIK